MTLQFRPTTLIALLLCWLITLPAVAAVHTQHGYALYGQPKYPDNFKHLDYVNPDAPKGGTLRVMGAGTFDTDQYRRLCPIRHQRAERAADGRQRHLRSLGR